MESPKPKVSVLMPVWNEEEHIAEAIESIINQTFKNWELIIIDDISEDDTINIARQYSKKDKRIRVVKLENKGYRTGALNAGLKNARGKYIAFLDGDDLYLPKKLELQVDFIEKNFDVGVVYSDIETFGEIDKLIIGIDFKENPLETLKELSIKDKKELTKRSIGKLMDEKEGKYIPGATAMIRKSIIGKNRFDENLQTIQDYDFWFQLIGKGVIFKRVPLKSYKYRVHSGQISKNRKRGEKSARYIIKKLRSGAYFK